jgi:TonB family protein
MARILFILILLFPIYNAFAQDTTYLNSNYEEVSKSDDFIHFKVLLKQNTDTIERYYSKEGKLDSENTYSSYLKRERNGLSQEWHENGALKSQINYKNGNLNGFLNTFWSNGKAKREDIYSNGEFTKGKCYDSTGLEIPHFEYMIPPEFPGGVNALLKFIADNTKYPRKARIQEIEGTIYIRFVIAKLGEVGSAKVMRPVHPLLDEEALRVIKSMPRWKPGYTDGNPVNVWYIIPIVFKLQ